MKNRERKPGELSVMKTILPFAVVLALALFFRLYRIGSIPPSPSLDEVTIAYNARSLAETGRDEYGTRLPILLRAYDDYRPALYVYAVVPFVAALGMNTLAVRLPSALASVLAVLIVYLLADELFDPERYSIRIGGLRVTAGLLAALFLTISPWHIFISRLGNEVNLGLTLYLFGIYAWLRGVRPEHASVWTVVSAVAFALTFYTYQSFKVLTPVMIVGLVWSFRNDILKRRSTYIPACFIFFLVSLPIVLASLSPGALLRVTGTSAFADNPLYRETDRLWLAARTAHDPVGTLLYNPKITSLRIFTGNYLSHLNLKWLLTGGYHEDFKVPYLGLLYPWELLMALAGYIWVLRGEFSRKVKVTISVWVWSSPLAAAFATMAPHAMRTLTAAPAIDILAAVLCIGILRVLKSYSLRMTALFVLLCIAGGSAAVFGREYFTVFPRAASSDYLYALSRAMPYLIQHQKDYSKIVVSNRGPLSTAYMYYLYWDRYDPVRYIRQGGTRSGGFAETHTIGKFEFRPIIWQGETPSPTVLFAGDPRDFPAGVGEHSFTNLDGSTGIVLARKL
ncbi:glycosyltransferase family 39 protein [Patescibacteria group bacterium]|nr:glycosyltransferase family 39 protein [Patescibacteria group bacterium]